MNRNRGKSGFTSVGDVVAQCPALNSVTSLTPHVLKLLEAAEAIR